MMFISHVYLVEMYKRLLSLKTTNPSLKVLLAIGGWSHGVTTFSNMVSSKQSMTEFALNSLTFLRDNNLDGIDLDWEYPANRGSPPGDKQRFTELIKVSSTILKYLLVLR